MWSTRSTNALRAFTITTRRSGHTVRIILREDLPPKGYKNDTITVRAGYARNKLIPTKHAVYATPENFDKFGLVDPLLMKKQEKRLVLSDREVMDKNAAFVLQTYLKNKVLKIWRNAFDDGVVHPGMVDATALRDKLSKQLKIDLEDHEKITIDPTPVNFLAMEKEVTESMIDGDGGVPVASNDSNSETIENCTVQLKRLGEYVATIHLSGGFEIPLKFRIIKR